ncbi:MAG: lysophospholipid acyltransferase family protein [Cognaticolwellia aestuarii]
MTSKVKETVKKLPRITATGIAFSMFGLGGLILAGIVLPLMNLIYRDSCVRKQKARQTVHLAFKFFIQLMIFLRLASFHIENKVKFRHLSGKLLLANHPSLIDVVLLISVVPNADCVVKAHLFRNPFIRGVIKNTGYISNEEPEALIAECKRSLAQGNNLIIFPEGTRTTPGQPLKFLRGAANIALRCHAKVSCASITVAPTTLTKNEKWYQVPNKKIAVVLKFLSNSPQIEGYEHASLSKDSRRYTQALEQFFTKELSLNDRFKN